MLFKLLKIAEYCKFSDIKLLPTTFKRHEIAVYECLCQCIEMQLVHILWVGTKKREKKNSLSFP